jgi:hypothetical protein
MTLAVRRDWALVFNLALAALLAVIAYAVAWQMSAGRRHARAAMLVVLFGFYMTYWRLGVRNRWSNCETD